MTFRRRHHYLAQSYLKRWTGADGRLWAYRLLVSHARVPTWKKASPRGIARKDHLYTVEITGSESDAIERWLDAKFEAPAQDAIERAVSGRRLTPEHWQRLAAFLAAQHVRTPGWLVRHMPRWNRKIPDIIDELRTSVQQLEAMNAAGERLPETAEESGSSNFPIRTTIEEDPASGQAYIKFEGIVGRALWLYYMKMFLTHTLSVLKRHRWTILRPPIGLAWPTSDDPVVLLNFTSTEKYDFGGGWASDGTNIFLPLSPEHLLYAQVGRKPPEKYSRFSDEQGRFVRRIIVEHANHLLLASDRDEDLVDLRPRVVDKDQFESERRQWGEWLADQAKAEREFAHSRAKQSRNDDEALNTTPPLGDLRAARFDSR